MCGGRGGAALVLALVACVLVPPQAGHAYGRATATGDQWLQPATDWDLVDDALTVAEGAVAALGLRIEHMYEDVYVGLAMVVDQLRLEIRRVQPALENAIKVARKSPPNKRPSYAKATRMLNRTRVVFNLALDIYQRGVPAYLGTLTRETAAGLFPIMRLGKWAFDFPPTRVSAALMEPPVPYKEFLEDFSDNCLSEVSRARKPEECKISKLCWDKMTDPFTDGYWLTHEIFYALIAYSSPCRHQFEHLLLRVNGQRDMRAFLRRTCSNIFRDATLESRHGVPEGYQDLFIEQVGFCGLAGFPEFYRPEWIRAIRSWQRSDGCFQGAFLDGVDPYKDFTTKKPGRTKRAEKILADRCRPHKTVLGAIAMATGLKYLVNLNNLTDTA